jgi:RNA polymerase-binding protein DksA
MDQEKLAAIRVTLETERASLERQLADLGAPTDTTDVEVSVDEGFADSAQATAERSEQLSMIEQQQAVYQEVLAALARMEEGTFGKCERCGQDIPIERLEALPTARLCLSCKQATSN